MSNYGNQDRDLPAAKEDAQTMHDNFRKMGVPENKIQHLVDPDQADFYVAIKNVKQSLQNGGGKSTQLFLHYAGHGMGNGGYIAQFAHDVEVNMSLVCSALSREFSNIWILMIFDACTIPQRVGTRANFTNEAPVGAYKTVILSAGRLGQQAFDQWKFTKSFAGFMAQKVLANQGLFKIPEDVFDFEGPNGEHELLMALTKKNFITLHFPVAGPLPPPLPVPQPMLVKNTVIIPVSKPVPKKYVFTYTTDVAQYPCKQGQEYPVKAKLNWMNPLNGVSRCSYYGSCQFISLDGTRSAFEFDSSYYKNHTWADHIVPQGKQIRRVETLLMKNDGYLCGFKWIGDDGAVLVAIGYIDDPKKRNDPLRVLQSLTLNHNQRLVGVKSYSGGFKLTQHFSFQWVICTEE